MERPYSRLMNSFSIAGDLLKITFLTKGYEKKSFLRKVLDPELWCLIIIAVLITTHANAQNNGCDALILQCADDITVECGDMLDPMYTGEPIINKDVNCPTLAQIGWLDNAQGNCPMIITRTWTATDDNGNTETCVQTITVLDTLAPVLTYYAQDMTVSCENVPDPAEVDAVDNCKDDLIVDFDEMMVTGSCPGEYTIIRMWYAEDDCDNSVTHSQTITVIDTTAPVVIGVPADITVRCGEVPPPHDNVTAEDNCKSLQTVYPSDLIVPGNCEGSYIIERTWWAEDDCGNLGWDTQIITVIDTIAPTIHNVPADITVECGEVPDPDPTVFATDDCKSFQTVYPADVTLPGNCPSSYVIERTWWAEDGCGNIGWATQYITVIDTLAPVLSEMPADTTVECGNVPAPILVTAVDDCKDNITVDYDETVFDGNCDKNYQLHRTWTATDDCGNSSMHTQIITVIDTVAPQIYLVGDGDDKVILCSDAIPVAPVAMAIDNCDENVQITAIDSTIAGACEQEFTIYREWTATDACGNSSMLSQTIMVIDTVAPQFNFVPADLTLDCGAVIPFEDAEAMDDCDQDISVMYEDDMIPGNCSGAYTILRTWTAMDDCGNSSSAVQMISIIDTIAPVFDDILADTTVTCGNVPPVPECTATDACDGFVPSFYDGETIVPGNCPGNYDIVRSWTAMDDCGNTVTQYQTVHVIDSLPPMIMELPNDTTVSCDAVPDPALVQAYDECDPNVGLILEETTIEGDCEGDYTLIRKWIATDACGNSTFSEQWITVIDTTGPVLIDVPQDMTVQCDQVPDPAEVTAVDACKDNIPVMFWEDLTPLSCKDEYQLTRTWTAMDDCGNMSMATQIIYVIDTIAPTFDCTPQDTVVDCFNIPNAMTCNATDNCDLMPVMNFTEVWSGSGCIGVYEIVRTWTAEDNCGNQATLVQTITVDNGPNISTNIDDLENGGIFITAYPNPFAESTTIRFELPETMNATLEVFDMRGRIVEVLFDGTASANTTIAKDFDPEVHGASTYIYRLSAGDRILHGRLVVTR